LETNVSELQVAIPLLIAGEIAIGFALLGVVRRGVPGAAPYAVLMMAAGWCSLAMALGLFADDVASKFAWLRVQYLGAAVVGPAWLAMILQYRRRQTALSDRLLALLAVEPVIILMLVWTDGVHGLVWGTPALGLSGSIVILSLEHGSAFWAHQAFTFLMLVGGAVYLLRDIASGDSAFRAQSLAIGLSGIAAAVGIAVSAAGVVHPAVDPAPVVMIVVGGIIAVAIFRYRLRSSGGIERDAVMEGMTEGAVVLDGRGRVVDMNPAAMRITGLSADQAMGNMGDEVLSRFGKVGNEVPLPSVTYAAMPGSIDMRHFEVRLSRMHKADGRKEGRLVVLRDVTQQKAAEAQLQDAKVRLEQEVHRQTSELTQELRERKFAEIALRDSEERSRQVIDTAYDAFVSMDANGAIIDWNPQAANVFGWGREEVLWKDLAELLMPIRSREAHRRGLRYYLTSGEGPLLSKPIETTALHQDGHEFEVEMTISPGIVKWLRVFNAFIHDITERKQAEHALKDSNAQLEEALENLENAQQQVIQQERLRALGQMASGIVHEFNNALSPIVGFSELLMVKPNILQDEARSKRYLESIRTAAQDASHVVSRLREFYRAREKTETTEPLDLNALINQTVTLTQPKWRGQAQAGGASVRVNMELTGRPVIQGDAASIREVLTNLIFNAVDAMSKGGRVVIRTSEQDGKVLLEIEDNGAGMPEDVVKHCMHPFFSTKGEKGTGLGLSLVHGIIDRHGGSVDIRSVVGSGTTFALTFPVSDKPVPAAKVEVTKGESGRSLHVLAVDDDRGVLEVIEAIVEAEGHEIVLANSAREALEELKSGTVDIVITDLAMPLMNGDKLAQIMKRMRPELPIIMLTGFAELMGDGEASVAVDTVISKPVSPAKLREAFDLVLVGS